MLALPSGTSGIIAGLSRAGPRRLFSRFLAVEKSHAKSGFRKLQGNGAARESCARNRYVKRCHAVILADLTLPRPLRFRDEMCVSAITRFWHATLFSGRGKAMELSLKF